MGIETIAMGGLQYAAADQSQKNAKAQANAIVQQGNIEASNKARETQLKAASATASFLNSGLTLEGTPGNAVQGIYDAGLADTNQIIANTNAASKNVYTKARAEAITSLLKSSNNFGIAGMNVGQKVAGLFPAGSALNPITWNQDAVPGSPENPIDWNSVEGTGIKQIGD